MSPVKEALDLFVEAMLAADKLSVADPARFKSFPVSMPISRPDETRAARELRVNFFDPPPHLRRKGRLNPGSSNSLWPQRTLEEWKDIGRRYDVSAVFASPYLPLPMEKTTFGNFALYFIPKDAD